MRSMRRSGGWGIAVGLVAAACTLPNAAYEGSDGGEPTEGSASTGATEGSVPTTTGEDASSGEEPPGPCVSDDDCADDSFCNGVETCDPASAEADEFGCVAGPGDPCDPAVSSCDEEQGRCVTECDVVTDADEDGVDAIECGGEDCDDSNEQVLPGALEICDDNDIDEDCDPLTFGDVDEDGDGAVSSACCNEVDGVPKCGGDCDDTLPGITAPGTDWAHCVGCGDGCGPLEACFAGPMCLPARRVFVTSETSTGNLGGLEGADQRCQEHADFMGLDGVFMAFLIDGTSGLDRLEHAEVPYVRLDGVHIAANWADLVDGTLAHPLYVDEQRNVIDGVTDHAWTGIPTFAGGEPFDAHCEGWTTSARGCPVPEVPCGVAGDVTEVNAAWAAPGFAVDCSFVHHLYCIEQMVPG